ncbi:hypothetical protein Gotri_007567 [Gossypium trilobum]|uniref:Xyloglucan endotransglucosylase/hydrolase n=1 Tax=Gossypium trilobum TaxID=34281 RepID=A0A7J9EGJ2_9ROSI|nr:hypothetical protein [Gossypium trilobum]
MALKDDFLSIFSCILAISLSSSILGRPATFLEDFGITWSDSHIKQIDGGRAIQLFLDQNSGCGFASKRKYLFGHISMKIKLISGDSAGTVTAFYMNSDTNTIRDELDFEFLGNRTGQPYTVQTNIYTHGKGDREQRVNLWFDPAADFHTYTIMWNHHHIVKAPFLAYYKDFDIEGCAVPGPTSCASNPRNWWEGTAYQSLNAKEARRYRWVRLNHMIYDYCTDKSRYPVPPREYLAGI